MMQNFELDMQKLMATQEHLMEAKSKFIIEGGML